MKSNPTLPPYIPVATGKPGLGRMIAQQADALTAIPSASQVLDDIMDEVNSGKVPIEIYPTGYISNLVAMGDQPIRSAMTLSVSDYALKPGDKANMKWLDATFTMGSPTSEAERDSDETQYTPIISYGFYIGNYEVTQNEYRQVMGSNPSWFQSANGYTDDPNRPIENVTYAQAAAYCSALTLASLANGSIPSGWVYRLPTEAEWEYSCRAGSKANIFDLEGAQVNQSPGSDFEFTAPALMTWNNTWYYDVRVHNTSDNVNSGGNLAIWSAGGFPYIGIDNGANHSMSHPIETWSGSGTIYNGGTAAGTDYLLVVGSAGGQNGNITMGDGDYLRINTGDPGSFSFGNTIRGGMANFDDHYEYDAGIGTINVTTPIIPALDITVAVGSYNENGFGLYDMHGNVSEWCQDWYGAYPNGTVVDPQGPTSGSLRVVRGGSWADHGVSLRSAARLGVNPGTASSHVGFRIVLAPSTPEWKIAVATQPSIKTYGVPPTKTKDGLVLITHGWTKYFPDQSWIDTMSSSISTSLANAGINDWQVYGYYWEPNSSTASADGALINAAQEGISLGNSIVNQGWTKVHLIAHSAGAEVIEVATEVIKGRAPSTIVQCTFLDPYVGTDYAGRTTYGNGADWSDRYASSHDIDALEGIFTDVPLYSSYNVDITALDPSLGNSGLFTGLSGYAVCSVAGASHGWAHDFYENTITGNNVTSDYAGFGFPLSIEAGGWPNAPTTYPVGNVNSVKVLGTQPQSCSLLGAIAATAGISIDFTASPKAAQSTSGTITTSGGTLTLITGSPAWLSIIPTNTDPANLLSFDANFTSTGTGAAGLLSVLWDSSTIGTLDERAIGQGVAHYTLHFPVTEANSTHVLSFRLDPFTNVQSTIVITNAVLSQQGVTQPFSLSATTNRINGAIVWQLTGQAGFDYGLQASTNLVSTNWTQIAVLENTNGMVSFYDQTSTNYPTRFYRAVAPY
ncbi:MAG: formylglycine-generating enzyme family protein [Patescibacteria group bacterium]|nr:formylglycine-generating enzyme family protein [Patescibacteria group bacterium]